MKVPAHPISRWIGLAFWIILGGLRLQETWQNARIVPALLSAQSGLIAWLLFTRRAQTVEASWMQTIVAWLSALVPLVLAIHHQTLLGQALISLGLLLVLWALSTLGRSFGIAPADRSLVESGPYNYVRHPMYLGELLSLAGAVSGDPSLYNLILIHILLVTLLMRLRWEERILSGYASYARRVRWRLLPGIW
jgi:protein-S-isoprenylcysteine O-methyltransferase Ste14